MKRPESVDLENNLLRCLSDMIGWADTFRDNLETYAPDCPMEPDDAARYQYELSRAKRLRDSLMHAARDAMLKATHGLGEGYEEVTV